MDFYTPHDCVTNVWHLYVHTLTMKALVMCALGEELADEILYLLADIKGPIL